MSETIQTTVAELELKTTQELKKEANRITRRNTLFAAGAGLIPVPVLDAATTMGIQISMIRSISKLYNVEFKENVVRSIIGSLVGIIGTAGVIKSIPGLGTLLGGAAGAVTGAAATYALGQVFAQHFDQGGTLLTFDPIKSREFFEKEFEAGRIFVTDVTKLEKEGKAGQKTGGFSSFFKSKRRKAEEQEQAELKQTNAELKSELAALRSEVAALTAAKA